MLHLVRCNAETVAQELAILNSQPDYMDIAYKKRTLNAEDVIVQHEEAKQYVTERYLVYNDNEALAIVDYGFSSPLQQLPWIQLLCLHADFTGKGYAKKVFQLVEQNMYKNGASQILIAVHASNTDAQQFWEKMHFQVFARREYEGEQFLSYKKLINCIG